jgi:hypothetical protein
MFKFLERRRENKIFWTDWQEAFSEINLLLICSWMQFWLVTVVPKHMNFAIFSEDLL